MTAITRDQYHRYSIGDGLVPGVTSMLKLQDTLEGGDLALWGAGKALEAVEASLPIYDRAEALRAVTAARDAGTAVHAQVERVLTGQPVPPDPLTDPYMGAFAAFLAAERPVIHWVEQPVYSARYRYGGTFDWLGVVRGERACVDVKTGKLKLTHRLQLTAYRMADYMGDTDTPMPRVKAQYVLLLRPGEWELVRLDEQPGDRQHVALLARTYHRMREWKG